MNLFDIFQSEDHFYTRDSVYDRADPQVPFNTPETLSSSSSAESSPEMPRRKARVLATLMEHNVMIQDHDDDYDHLDFQRADHLVTDHVMVWS